MPRMPWMGYVRPKMRNRRCSACGREYAQWFGFIPMSHDTARKIAFAWVFAAVALGIIGSTAGIVWLIQFRHATGR